MRAAGPRCQPPAWQFLRLTLSLLLPHPHTAQVTQGARGHSEEGHHSGWPPSQEEILLCLTGGLCSHPNHAQGHLQLTGGLRGRPHCAQGHLQPAMLHRPRSHGYLNQRLVSYVAIPGKARPALSLLVTCLP